MSSIEEYLKQAALDLQAKNVTGRDGKLMVSSPSNIALVKYWGKYPVQLPANASLSITLKEAKTIMEISFKYEKGKPGSLNFTFEGKENPAFKKRIEKFLGQIEIYLPWLANTRLTIDSRNTFPHSSGIASSASAMSALAFGLYQVEAKFYGLEQDAHLLEKASFLARLGSGSACRSLYPKMAAWGKTAAWKNASQEVAISIDEIHPGFENIKDSILIIESGQKQVSSSLGHDLMKDNKYAETRFELAESNMQELAGILKTGNWGAFIDIMENEALQLHAMMMTSSPGYLLMKPNTLEAITRIREYRLKSGKHLGFTLDAGANVHVIYDAEEAEEIKGFIDKELKELCEDGSILHDEMGNGPEVVWQ